MMPRTVVSPLMGRGTLSRTNSIASESWPSTEPLPGPMFGQVASSFSLGSLGGLYRRFSDNKLMSSLALYALMGQALRISIWSDLQPD